MPEADSVLCFSKVMNKCLSCYLYRNEIDAIKRDEKPNAVFKDLADKKCKVVDVNTYGKWINMTFEDTGAFFKERYITISFIFGPGGYVWSTEGDFDKVPDKYPFNTEVRQKLFFKTSDSDEGFTLLVLETRTNGYHKVQWTVFKGSSIKGNLEAVYKHKGIGVPPMNIESFSKYVWSIADKINDGVLVADLMTDQKFFNGIGTQLASEILYRYQTVIEELSQDDFPFPATMPAKEFFRKYRKAAALLFAITVQFIGNVSEQAIGHYNPVVANAKWYRNWRHEVLNVYRQEWALAYRFPTSRKILYFHKTVLSHKSFDATKLEESGNPSYLSTAKTGNGPFSWRTQKEEVKNFGVTEPAAEPHLSQQMKKSKKRPCRASSSKRRANKLRMFKTYEDSFNSALKSIPRVSQVQSNIIDLFKRRSQ